MRNKVEKENWQNNRLCNMAMGEFKNWQRKYCIVKKNYKHTEGGYGRLPLGDVYTCHGILLRIGKFEKSIP